MNMYIDLTFPLMAQASIPVDHGYALYGAISRILPSLHENNGIGIHPLRGRQIGDRRLQLNDRSRLVIRVASDRIAELLPLAGKSMDVAGSCLRLRVPQVFALQPRPSLRSRLVTTKNCQDPARFETELQRQLTELHVSNEAVITIPKRRTLRIKSKEVVGYEVSIEGLTAAESLTIQERGLGGRRHMGCGVFVPLTRQTGEPHD